ncbi:MAG: hypothetical protein ACFE9S_15680 [Candidatus Hermodarchaeota archaeon]
MKKYYISAMILGLIAVGLIIVFFMFDIKLGNTVFDGLENVEGIIVSNVMFIFTGVMIMFGIVVFVIIYYKERKKESENEIENR